MTLLLAAALAACGGGGHKPRSGRGHPARKATPARTATATPASRGVRTVDGYFQEARLAHYRLTIYDLRRTGPYVVLDLGVVCEEPAGVGCGSRFDFAMPQGSPAFLNGLNEVSGITLVDPTADKQYAVVTDSQLHPQATKLPLGSIEDNGLHLAWAKFPAPPRTTRALDVVFPGGGPQVPLVPIADAAAPLPAQLGAGGTPAVPGDGVRPAGSTSTAGMTLPATNLITTVGNPAGSDAESGRRATITLRADVLFHFAKSSLTSRARAILRQVGAKLAARAAGPVEVTGYTDSIGPDRVNLPLSRARAAAVVRALEPRAPGVPLHATGRGAADPVAPNTKRDGSDNPAGRALNRRVTIGFRVHAPAPAAPPAPVPAPSAPPASAARTVHYRMPGDTQNSWRVHIAGIHREGDLAVMDLGITCTLEAGDACNAAQDFIGTQDVPPLSDHQDWLANPPSSFWSLGGFYLTDPTTGTVDIPVYLAAHDPLTSPLGNNDPAGETFPLWIYFPAPAASTVTVSLPGGVRRIADVPVS
jgi:outer membrane protein OmpA-like peptidoglycan-associated protein